MYSRLVNPTMAMKSLHLHLFLNLRRSIPLSTISNPLKLHFSSNSNSFTKTPYPYQYEMIISRPANPPKPRFRTRKPTSSLPQNSQPETNFDEWVDNKLLSSTNSSDVMDKGKRKYYNKRRKRMYGEEEEEEEERGDGGGLIELKQEVVELGTLHKRQEELYFYDAFAYPWEKDKHYKMVYQMEKKFFPDQGFDKAFLEPGKGSNVKTKAKKKDVDVETEERLVFFEEEKVTEKKVEDFFKCLNKFGDESVEPFFSSRSVGLPPKWDGPYGTVVLVNKPKGGFFFYSLARCLIA